MIDKSQIHVAFSANDAYAPFLLTTMTSLAINSNLGRHYNLHILTEDISTENLEIIIRSMGKYTNITVSFFNVGDFFHPYKKKFSFVEHFRVEVYYRLTLHELFPELKKIIYLDSDLIVLSDVAELFDMELSDYVLGAAREIGDIGMARTDANRRDFLLNVLQLNNCEDAFNSGVLIVNLESLRSIISVSEILNLSSEKNFPTVDQDLLNYLFHGKIKYISMQWNVLYDYWRRMEFARQARRELFEEYIHARASPKIVHYAGYPKPWHQPDSDFSEFFWHYARQHQLYSSVLHASISYAIKKSLFGSGIY